ncbi:tyrosine-type recombinase/integrase [Haloarculaceae archaeon H-GB2-1]|nr:tyrosine-type recombinase/integrase [Haloarculaceae archaeon H-GB1-1]MEA5386647.1 tyrosine-type recombinase/integrase [Haloarculaceae archaeon H-GB11]MEA5408171.1 tyrosine-type recombinase/integrase [Haloarculaceae archaeon H-GB2-1]
MGTVGDELDPDDDPIEYYVDELTFHGKSQRTLDAYERVLREFESFVTDPTTTGQAVDSLGSVGRRECMAWVHSLRDDCSPSTVATYASYLHRFYSYMTQVGAFDANPMALVREEMDESIDTDPTRRDVSLDEMRSFLTDITHPLDRSIFVTLLKTGMRVGELCNLDLQDLHLDGVPTDGVNPRVAIAGRPDSLFVDNDPARGAEHNGETRTASNKRKRDTVIPVDAELKSVLSRWLLARPDARSPAEPVFCSTTDEWGRRLTPAMVRRTVRMHAQSAGWYRTGASAAENVTPHYFRHFFTTHMRDRTGDRGIVKYLRGDVAQDVIDTYTHDWGGRVRTVYESNVYTLL